MAFTGSEAASAPAATAAGPTATTQAKPRAGSGLDQGQSAGSEAAALTEWDSFRINLLANARYHEDRERFFARLHRCAMFVVVTSGTATFAFVKAVPYLAGAITLAGLLDLVFDLSGKARLHASLRRRIYDVLAQAEDETRKLVKLKEQAVQIYADEPPCMHAVNAIAYNGAMQALDRPRKYLLKVGWWYRLLRHWNSFGSTKFKTFAEIEAEQAPAAR